MAMYQIEPFGGAVEDRRHGDLSSLVANAHFGSKDKAFAPDDFMLGDTRQSQESDEPVLLDDPVAQSNLIRATMFGLPPRLD